MRALLAYLSYLFLAASLGAAYWFMVRPLMRKRPAFAELYAATDSFWAAFWIKLDTIKTKMLSVLLIIASGLVAMHDFLIPLSTGLNWEPVTSLVPAVAWPFITIAFNALFLWLRKQTEDSAALKLVAVEAGVVTAAQAIHGDARTEVAITQMPVPLVVEAEVARETATADKPKKGG